MGATAGTALDAIHVHSATTAYSEPWRFGIAWWVPLLFGGAAVAIGFLRPLVELAAASETTSPSRAPSGPGLALGISMFVAAYLASGVAPGGSATKSVILAAIFGSLLVLLDRSRFAFITAIISALGGILVEVVLVSTGTFHYTIPDHFGVPSWLPLLYASAGLVVGLVGKKLLLRGLPDQTLEPELLIPKSELPSAVFTLCFGVFLNRAGSTVLAFLSLYLQQELDVGAETATGALGAFGLGSIFGAPIGGVVADRFGRKPAMLTALIGGATCLLIMPNIRSVPLFIAAIFLFSMISELYRPAAMAMLGDLVGPALRPRAFSFYYVAINLGFAVGAWVGGSLAVRSFSALFFLDAASALLFACIIGFKIKETLPSSPSAKGEALGRSAAIAHIAQNRAFMAFLLSIFLVGVVFHQAMSTLPLYLSGRGFDASAYGRLISLNGVMIVILQIPTGRWLERFDRALVLGAGSLLIALGFGFTGLVASAPFFALSIAIWTLGEIFQANFNGTVVTDLSPPELRARYFGALSTAFGLAMCVGPPLGGLLLSKAGAGWLWGSCFATALLSAGILVLFRTSLRAHPPP